MGLVLQSAAEALFFICLCPQTSRQFRLNPIISFNNNSFTNGLILIVCIVAHCLNTDYWVVISLCEAWNCFFRRARRSE
jgi:hypothetical protein